MPAPHEARHDPIPAGRQLPARRRRHADGGMEARGGRRPTSTTTTPSRGAGESGELVESEVLAGPDLAKIVTSDGAGDGRHRRPVPGVQGVAGRLPDRRRRVGGAGDRDRGAALGRARAGRRATQQPIQVRQVMDGSPADATRWTSSSSTWAADAEPRRPASRTCCATLRRRSSARSPAGRATSTPPRTPSRRRCSRRPGIGPATASRRTRAAGCSGPPAGG